MVLRHPLTATLAMLVICAAIAPIGLLAGVQLDRMLVVHVRVSGAGEASPRELRHLAELRNGERWWQVDTEQVARNVERHPWVRRASVRRVFPDAVQIDVEEHRPVALLHHERLYYVAADGTVFLPARPHDLDYPSLTGVSPELGRRHPALPRHVVSDALALLDALDERGLLTRDRVDEVHFSPTRGYTVHAGPSRVLFQLDGRSRQLDRLAALLSSGVVDLDRALHVDLGPRTVAIVRPLAPPRAG